MPRRHLIIGGNAAGLSAASQIKRLSPGDEVIVLEKGNVISYGSCSLPLLVSGAIPPSSSCTRYDAETFGRDRDVMVRLDARVVSIDHLNNRVTFVSGERDEVLMYDRLLMATGSVPVIPGPFQDFLSFNRSANVFTLKRPADARAIMEFIETRRPRTMAIVGGGLVGLEMAEAFHARGIQSTIIEGSAGLLSGFHTSSIEAVEKAVSQNGVNVLTDTIVTGVSWIPADVIKLRLSSGASLEIDGVLIAASSRPETDLLPARVSMDSRGALMVDEQSRTSIQNIWAAGDCAAVRSFPYGEYISRGNGARANRMGRAAGANMAGKITRLPPFLGSVSMRVFGIEVGSAGVIPERMRASGNISTIVHEHLGLPGRTTVVLEADRFSGAIVRCECSGHGAAARANMAAIAILSGMKPSDLAWSDIGYTPVLNTPWDALNVAAERLSSQMRLT